jgi:hypothetical protein
MLQGKSILGVTALATVALFTPVLETTEEQCIAPVSGTIRWVDPTTWEAITDAGHEPTGIASVELMANRVRIHHDFTATKVSSVQVTPDEAFASVAVRTGASVGLTYTDVFFYLPATGSTPVNPALLTKAGANVWVTGIFWDECEVVE